MRLLVLGGTRFVGRLVIDDALARGWDVTALHRGVTGGLPPRVDARYADRTDPAAVATALRGETWDVAVDTWSGAPAVATATARVLAGRVGHYGYVSSRSVYTWGRHNNEDSPLVTGDPDAQGGAYPESKRGAELGVLDSFGQALLARAGLILGPYEDIGRLPWWLSRISRGGRMVAPGRPERPLQYVDGRDLAGWLLSALERGLSGPVDVSGPSGHSTTARLLRACVRTTGSDAELVWVSDADLATAGAQPWTQLPCWVPETAEFAGFLESDTSKAEATGLVCRPVDETVADTWRWIQQDGIPAQRNDREIPGLPTALEQQLLATR